jgi:hypothetical protein
LHKNDDVCNSQSFSTCFAIKVIQHSPHRF